MNVSKSMPPRERWSGSSMIVKHHRTGVRDLPSLSCPEGNEKIRGLLWSQLRPIGEGACDLGLYKTRPTHISLRILSLYISFLSGAIGWLRTESPSYNRDNIALELCQWIVLGTPWCTWSVPLRTPSSLDLPSKNSPVFLGDLRKDYTKVSSYATCPGFSLGRDFSMFFLWIGVIPMSQGTHTWSSW